MKIEAKCLRLNSLVILKKVLMQRAALPVSDTFCFTKVGLHQVLNAVDGCLLSSEPPKAALWI